MGGGCRLSDDGDKGEDVGRDSTCVGVDELDDNDAGWGSYIWDGIKIVASDGFELEDCPTPFASKNGNTCSWNITWREMTILLEDKSR